MHGHLRSSLLLLVLTVAICCVLYPLVLWGIGQTVFRDGAQGSLVTDADGKVVGSRLIAQEFKGDEYFQPRPSAASYNGVASGASNFGASNYQLRDRVARQLGPMVRYGKGAEKDGKKPGDLVGPDIEKWFQQDRFQNKAGIVSQWASLHSSVAAGWIKDTDSTLKEQAKKDDSGLEPGQWFLMQLLFDDPALYKSVAGSLKHPESATPAELAKEFFPLFSSRYPGEWLTLEEDKTDKKKRKKLVRVKESDDIRSMFFDMWRQEHPQIALEEVPADMVTASASGLDPHVTLKNAQYQLKYRVAEARAKKMIREHALKMRKDLDGLDEKQRTALEEQARKAIEARVGKLLEEHLSEVIAALLNESAGSPLGGLAGVPLVNVLEVNLAMDQRLQRVLE
jgi:K+-transporting ATPase ATPase C chain